MTNHVMIDLETLGQNSFAPILSIGACRFDPHTDDPLLDTFHVGVDLYSVLKAGAHVDATTLEWWLDPLQEAARIALQQVTKVTLDEALDGFSHWFGPNSTPVWGNGATFDNVILRNSYVLMQIPCPWAFWHDRCFRTLKSMSSIPAPEFLGTAHDALSDSLHQARWLRRIALAGIFTI